MNEKNINIIVARSQSLSIQELFTKFLEKDSKTIDWSAPEAFTKKTKIGVYNTAIEIIDTPADGKALNDHKTLNDLNDSIIIAFSLQNSSGNIFNETTSKNLRKQIIEHRNLPIIILGIDDGSRAHKFDKFDILEAIYDLKQKIRHNTDIEYMECSLTTGKGIKEVFEAAAKATLAIRENERIGTAPKIKKTFSEKLSEAFKPKKSDKENEIEKGSSLNKNTQSEVKTKTITSDSENQLFLKALKANKIISKFSFELTNANSSEKEIKYPQITSSPLNNKLTAKKSVTNPLLTRTILPTADKSFEHSTSESNIFYTPFKKEESKYQTNYHNKSRLTNSSERTSDIKSPQIKIKIIHARREDEQTNILQKSYQLDAVCQELAKFILKEYTVPGMKKQNVAERLTDISFHNSGAENINYQLSLLFPDSKDEDIKAIENKCLFINKLSTKETDNPKENPNLKRQVEDKIKGNILKLQNEKLAGKSFI